MPLTPSLTGRVTAAEAALSSCVASSKNLFVPRRVCVFCNAFCSLSVVSELLHIPI